MKINKRRPAFEYGLINNTKELFSTIFNATPVALVLLAWPDQKVLKVNKATLALLKIKDIDVFNKKYSDIFISFTRDRLTDKDFFQSKLKVKKSSGSYVFLTIKARLFDKSKVILTLEDITVYKNKERKLLKLVQLDGLTGLLNHETIIQRLKEELSRAKRYHLPLSCLLLDVDDFKTINDQFGHLQGDQCLKKIARILKINMRETDMVGRYGGDEFLIILPETPPKEAWVPAQRIHSYFLKNPLSLRFRNVKSTTTLSIGISGYPVKGIETVKDIINHADKSLYESKVKGGNQIVFQNA